MYFYRFLSKSGRILEYTYEDFFDALKECIKNTDNCGWSEISLYDSNTKKFKPIFIPRILK